MEINLTASLLILLLFLPIFVLGVFSGGFRKRFMPSHSHTKTQFLIEVLAGFFYFLVILSIFFTAPKENIFLNSASLLIYFAAFFLTYLGYYRFLSSKENCLIISFPYSISRNPTYFFTNLAILAIVIQTMSVISFFLLLIGFLLMHIIILREEEYCKKEFRSGFLEYSRKVRRYI